MKRYILVCVLALTFLAGIVFAGQEEEADTVSTGSRKDELEIRVTEIFGKSCATSTCHGGEHPKMQLSLEAEEIPANMIGVPSKQNGELMLIDTKDPSLSYLLLKVTGGEGMKGKKMPVMLAPLTDDELASVMTWVRGFAEEAPLSRPIINELHPANHD